jgi:CRISPR-associated protein Cmr1
MRKPPTAELVEVKPKAYQERITQVRRYRLITPLFGGGVKPKEADPIKTIRETGIRGQLRFWWRATRGKGTLAEMKRREDALWGSAGASGSVASLVSIAVKDVNRGSSIPPNESSIPKYAAFPLEPSDNLRVSIEFTLEISFPKVPQFHQTDAEAALWAWETFGGVGGRTRRGFGALQLLVVDGVQVEPLKADDAAQKIREKLTEVCLVGSWTGNNDTPHLLASSTIAVSKTKRDSLDAWRDLIDSLQRFRQSPRSATKYKGESDWSEPDAIRRAFGTSALYRAPSHSVNKFPRAQFGLPIIFKFKNDDVNAGDPDKTTLEGRHHNRLASPLILRPIACADGKAVGVALILETPRTPPGGVELKGYRGPIQTDLVASDIAHIAPMNAADPSETDVLKSFLKTVK